MTAAGAVAVEQPDVGTQKEDDAASDEIRFSLYQWAGSPADSVPLCENIARCFVCGLLAVSPACLTVSHRQTHKSLPLKASDDPAFSCVILPETLDVLESSFSQVAQKVLLRRDQTIKIKKASAGLHQRINLIIYRLDNLWPADVVNRDRRYHRLKLVFNDFAPTGLAKIGKNVAIAPLERLHALAS